jgi:hypothetical protein
VRIFGIFHWIDGQFWVFAGIRMNAEEGGGKDRAGGFLKKGKILIVGLIALLMACGLVLTGCADKCPVMVIVFLQQEMIRSLLSTKNVVPPTVPCKKRVPKAQQPT